jgi:type II secretory pathway component PulK
MLRKPAFAFSSRRRRAVALVLTLWLIVIMTVIAYSTLFEANINVELTRSIRDRFYARVAARSGVGRAMVDLLNDKRFDMATAEAGERPFDAKGDPWASVEDDYVGVALTPGQFTVRVEDEESRLPLSERIQLPQLMALMEVLGMKEEEDRERTAAAIIDYMDFDTAPRFNGATEETEDASYAELIIEDLRLRKDAAVAYRKKNDRIQWVDELADIYGVSGELFYGSVWTDKPDKRLSWRRPRYHSDRYGYERNERPGLRELVTVFPTGGLNLNTARPEILHAIFSSNSEGLKAGEDAAKKILSERPEPRSDHNPNNNDAFKTPNDLANAGVTGQALAQNNPGMRLQVNSNYFRIISEGEVRGARHRIETVVRRDWDSFQRDDTRGLENGGGRSGRQGETRSRGRDEDQLIQAPALRVLTWTEE